MNEAIQQAIRKQITALSPLEEPALNALMASWEELTVKRKTLLTREGECEGYLYLVLEGVQHAVCLHENREATLVFTYPYSFSGILDSFLLQQPSAYRLETLTASRLLRLPHARLMGIIQEHPALDRWMWTALAGIVAGLLQRQAELLTFSATEKFTALMRRSPQVLNLIPHKYLASYIGVDATTFSKMLGSVRM